MAENKQLQFSVDIDTSQAVKNIQNYQNEIQRLNEKLKTLKEQEKKNDISAEEYQKQVIRITETKKAYQKQIREESNLIQNSLIATNDKLTDTLKAKRAELALNKAELAKMTIGTEEYLQKQQEILALNDEVKEQEAAYGVFQRQVGDYENAVKRALQQQAPFLSGMAQTVQSAGGVGNAFGAMGTAIKNVFNSLWTFIKTNPITALFAAIAAAIVGLINAFKSSEEATARWNAVLAPLGRAMDALLLLVQNLGKGVLYVAEGISSVIARFSKLAEKLPLVGGWFKEMNEASREAIELEKAKLALEKQEREDLVANAQGALEVAKLRKQAKDRENNTIAERIAALKQADKIEEDIAKRNVEREKERLRIMEVEASWADNNAETNRKIAEQQAKVYQAEQAYFQHTMRLQEQMTSALNEMATERYNRQKALLDAEAALRAEIHKFNSIYLYDYTKSVQENAALEFKAKQAAAMDELLLRQDVTKKLIALEVDTKKITAEQANQRLKLLSAELVTFQTQQLAETDAYVRAASAAAIELAGGAIFERALQSVRDQYADAMAAIRRDTSLTTDEQAYYIAKLEEAEIKAIDEVTAKHTTANGEVTNTYEERLALLNAELQVAWDNADAQYRLRREFLEKELQAEQLAAEKRAELEQQLFELNRQNQERKIQLVFDYINQAMSLFGELNNFMAQLDSNELARAENKHTKEKELLDEQLAAGLISQGAYNKKTAQLDEDLAKKKAKLEREQAVREKAMSAFQIAIDTAAGIMRAFANLNPLLAIPMAALIGATGAVQLATVLATPLPQAREGGMVVGASHEQGGVLIEAEGGERIVSADPSRAFPELLNLISYIGKHSSVPNTNYAARTILAGGGGTTVVEPIDYNALAEAIGNRVGEQLAANPVYLSLTELADAQQVQARIDSNSRN